MKKGLDDDLYSIIRDITQQLTTLGTMNEA